MLDRDNDSLFLELHGKMNREELEELFASKAVKSNPDIVNNVMVFEKLCLALNGIVPNFEHVEEPSMLMVCGAVHKLKKLGLDPDNFSESVKKYIACVAFHDGFVVLPSICAGSQKFLDGMISDVAQELFKDVTLEVLASKDPWDDEDPVSNHCAKIQAVDFYLKHLDGEK